MQPSLAIVGDLAAENRFRAATDAAIRHAADRLGEVMESRWIGTAEIAPDAEKILNGYSGLWIAPGSPYDSMDGALAAIRFARERRTPLLGTCGGFQHIILEYARNVLGFIDADHTETNPYASRLFISRLTCSLVGRTMTITFKPGSRVAQSYGQPTAQEGYYCNFGVNPDYVDKLRSGDLQIAASDTEGEVRAVELTGHPFFVGTLFIPQLRTSAQEPHPIVIAFVRAAVEQHHSASLR